MNNVEAGACSEAVSEAMPPTCERALPFMAEDGRGYARSAKSLCWDGDDASCFSGVASNMTTLSLRQGATTLNVSNLSKPVLISFAVSPPANMSGFGGSCDPDPGEECRDGASATEEARIGEEVTHQSVAVDDAALGRPQRLDGPDPRGLPLDLRAIDPLERGDT